MFYKKRLLKRGEEVTICLSKEDRAVSPGMWKYNNKKALISKITGNGQTYELWQVLSEAGKPYTFTKDMLYVKGE